jgi:hypothetical protein
MVQPSRWGSEGKGRSGRLPAPGTRGVPSAADPSLRASLSSLSLLLPLLLLILVPASLRAAIEKPEVEGVASTEARIWFDRGVDPVLQRGDRVRVYFRASRDAYTAVFHIDTNGVVRLLFPSAPGDPQWVRGGQDYRLLLPGTSTWSVDEDPGMGYFFLLVSPEPLDYSALGYSALTGGWDLSRVSARVYGDPYLAMDDFVEALLPDWEYADFALDYTSYHVGQSYSYPRFLCYDCHTYQSYRSWNPYHQACTSFRVVIYNDPYYYPSTRYRGTRVVHSRPPLSRQPQFAFKERAAGEPGTPLVQARDGSAGGGGGALPRELTRQNLTREGTGPDRGTRVPLRSEVRETLEGNRLPDVIRGRTGITGQGDDAARPAPRVQPGAEPGDRPTTRTRPTLERRPPPDRGGGAANRPSPSGGAGQPASRPQRPAAGSASSGGGTSGAGARPSGGVRPSAGSRPGASAPPGRVVPSRPSPSTGQRPTAPPRGERPVPSRPPPRGGGGGG